MVVETHLSWVWKVGQDLVGSDSSRVQRVACLRALGKLPLEGDTQKAHELTPHTGYMA